MHLSIDYNGRMAIYRVYTHIGSGAPALPDTGEKAIRYIELAPLQADEGYTINKRCSWR
jgi:hypothetical protein